MKTEFKELGIIIIWLYAIGGSKGDAGFSSKKY